MTHIIAKRIILILAVFFRETIASYLTYTCYDNSQAMKGVSGYMVYKNLRIILFKDKEQQNYSVIRILSVSTRTL